MKFLRTIITLIAILSSLLLYVPTYNKLSAEVLYKKFTDNGINVSQNSESYINTSGDVIRTVDLGNGYTMSVWSDDSTGSRSVFAQKYSYEGEEMFESGGRQFISSADEIGNGDFDFPVEGVASDFDGGFYLGYYLGTDFILDHFNGEAQSNWMPVTIENLEGATFLSDPSGNLFVAGWNTTTDDIDYYIYSSDKTLLDSGTFDQVDGTQLSRDGLILDAPADGEYYIGWRVDSVGSNNMRLAKVGGSWNADNGIVLGTSSFEQDNGSHFLDIDVEGEHVFAIWKDHTEEGNVTNLKIQILDRTTGALALVAAGQIIRNDVIVPNTLVSFIDSNEDFYVAWTEVGDPVENSMVQKYDVEGNALWNGGSPLRVGPIPDQYEERGFLFELNNDIYFGTQFYDDIDGTEGAKLYRIDNSGNVVWEDGRDLTTNLDATYSAYIYPRIVEPLLINGRLYMTYIVYDMEDWYENLHWNYFTLGYQIANLDQELNAEIAGVNIEEGSENGQIGSPFIQIVGADNNLRLAHVQVDLSQDRDWSTVTGAITEDGKSVISGLGTAPGVVDSFLMYTLKMEGDDGVRVCPDAEDIESVTTNCSGGYFLQIGDAELSEVTIAMTEYWEVSGLTGTGIMSTVVPEEPEYPDEENPEENNPGENNSGGQQSQNTNTGNNNQNLGSSGEEEDGDDDTQAPASFPVSEVVNPTNGGIGAGGGGKDDLIDTGTDSKEQSFYEYSNFQKVVESVAPPVVVAAATVAGAALLNGTLGNYTAIFLGFVIWRKRKYWGIVYDSSNFSPLAFTTIRAYRLLTSGETFVTQTVSDLNGLYGLNISDAGNYRIEYLIQGFRTISKTVTLTRNQDVILDVPMIRDSQRPQGLNLIRYIWKQNAVLIMQIIRIIVLALLGYGALLTLRVVGLSPTIINILVLVLYALAFVVQLIVIVSPYLNRASGAVVDTATKKPIAGAIVRFLDPAGRMLDMENMAITNSSGQIKVRIKPEIYKYNAYASGYKQAEGMIRVNPDGKLSSSIKLEKSEDQKIEFGQ